MTTLPYQTRSHIIKSSGQPYLALITFIHGTNECRMEFTIEGPGFVIKPKSRTIPNGWNGMSKSELVAAGTKAVIEQIDVLYNQKKSEMEAWETLKNYCLAEGLFNTPNERLSPQLNILIEELQNILGENAPFYSKMRVFMKEPEGFQIGLSYKHSHLFVGFPTEEIEITRDFWIIYDNTENALMITNKEKTWKLKNVVEFRLLMSTHKWVCKNLHSMYR